MSQVLTHTDITCPYCHSASPIEIDIIAGSQDYIEDCQVCCNPIQLSIEIDADGEVTRIDVQPGNS
ncbi:MAG: CPXCG motif-containing cysteine-rich protein [Candidatus Thiothrix putei]|jgi:hypothetical protein|uniref:Cysteine-rich CPXCG n=2 Tax=Thiothrix TaxID=1030 RepID=A0A1H4BRY3_9GAMM|nr:CPXCG motif-containing cysteine-rich protein [Thiothrix caldifontis]WGZ95243.1 MAG: CPXCG motif-containing cysteine-rich protein [Candidatus Thiothrix putei]SEA50864.1 Cysteine-rich CPXCG [Thiothrix caldifontis]